jgi:hypothetical protein
MISFGGPTRHGVRRGRAAGYSRLWAAQFNANPLDIGPFRAIYGFLGMEIDDAGATEGVAGCYTMP